MRHDDQQLGVPETIFTGTKAECEAFTTQGMIAFATDIGLFGYRDPTAWVWGSGVAENSMIILYHPADQSITQYDATDAGFTSALAAAVAGDVIWLPIAEIPNDHTVPDDVDIYGRSVYVTRLTGKLTLLGAASIADLRLEISENSSDPVIAVTGPNANKTVLFNNVSIDVDNSGSGDAVVYKSQDGQTIVSIMHFHPTAAAGTAYWVYRNGGTVRASYCTIYGTANTGTGVYTYGCTFDLALEHGTVMDGDLAPYQHVINHGHGGTDPMIEISASDPVTTFPGKLWLKP